VGDFQLGQGVVPTCIAKGMILDVQCLHYGSRLNRLRVCTMFRLFLEILYHSTVVLTMRTPIFTQFRMYNFS
jgi:hypothetical protein